MPDNLERFIVEQERAYRGALEELRAGRKTGHWIWFVFPQVAGLGQSAMSQRFSIPSMDEAKAYLGTRSWAPDSANAPASSWRRAVERRRTSSARSTP